MDIAAHSVNATDRAFAAKTAQSNAAEVELGKLAEKRGGTPAMKNFGKTLATDHYIANYQLKAVARNQGMALLMVPNSDQRTMADNLSKLSGSQFDREFAKDAVRDHREDIKCFQQEVAYGQNVALKAYASKQIPILQAHLRTAENMERSQSPGKTTPAPVTR
jgi:putative membrane protein